MALTGQEILDNILTPILAEQFGVKGKVVMTASLTDDLGADSLDLVELPFTVEEWLGIEISDEEAEGLRTVLDVVKLLDEKLTAKGLTTIKKVLDLLNREPTAVSWKPPRNPIKQIA